MELTQSVRTRDSTAGVAPSGGQLLFPEHPETVEQMVNGLGTVLVVYLLTDGFGGVAGEFLEELAIAAEGAVEAGIQAVEVLFDALAPMSANFVEDAQRYGDVLTDIAADWVDIFLGGDTIREGLPGLMEATPRALVPQDLLDDAARQGGGYGRGHGKSASKCWQSRGEYQKGDGLCFESR